MPKSIKRLPYNRTCNELANRLQGLSTRRRRSWFNLRNCSRRSYSMSRAWTMKWPGWKKSVPLSKLRKMRRKGLITVLSSSEPIWWCTLTVCRTRGTKRGKSAKGCVRNVERKPSNSATKWSCSQPRLWERMAIRKGMMHLWETKSKTLKVSSEGWQPNLRGSREILCGCRQSGS